MVPAAGIERYAPTDNTQLIEKVRTQEPLNPLYARLLCTKSCTTKSGAAALLIDSGATKITVLACLLLRCFYPQCPWPVLNSVESARKHFLPAWQLTRCFHWGLQPQPPHLREFERQASWRTAGRLYR